MILPLFIARQVDEREIHVTLITAGKGMSINSGF